MKDARLFEFPGSSIVQILAFAIIVCLKVFGIWESNWLIVILVALVGSAIATGIISSFYHSINRDIGPILIGIFIILGLICLLIFPALALYPFFLVGLIFIGWIFRRMSR